MQNGVIFDSGMGMWGNFMEWYTEIPEAGQISELSLSLGGCDTLTFWVFSVLLLGAQTEIKWTHTVT